MGDLEKAVNLPCYIWDQVMCRTCGFTVDAAGKREDFSHKKKEPNSNDQIVNMGFNHLKHLFRNIRG